MNNFCVVKLRFYYDAMGNRVSKSIVQHTVSGSIDNSTTARTYYVRDAQGNVIAVYEQKLQGNTMSIKQAETHIYGTQRLGISYPSIEMIGNSGLHTDSTKYYYGHKDYELTNHLGNVLATVSDRKIPVDKDNDAIIDNYVADITSVKDYGPFGEYLQGRTWRVNEYPKSFNNKRDEEELFGWQDYGERMYIKGLRRFEMTDPIIVMQHKYQDLSPYQFASNTPIWGVDKDGLEVRVYIEQADYIRRNLGHTFISVGSDKDLVVYSYGRYDDIYIPSSGNLSPIGEGVLIKLTGKNAIDMIDKYLNEHKTYVFEVKDIDTQGEKKVKDYFDKQFNQSNSIPDNPKGKYYKNSNARIVDKYNLFLNNCTTKTCEALKEGGTYIFENEEFWFPSKQEYSQPQVKQTTKRLISPSELFDYLNTKSKENNSSVKPINNDDKKNKNEK